MEGQRDKESNMGGDEVMTWKKERSEWFTFLERMVARGERESER